MRGFFLQLEGFLFSDFQIKKAMCLWRCVCGEQDACLSDTQYLRYASLAANALPQDELFFGNPLYYPKFTKYSDKFVPNSSVKLLAYGFLNQVSKPNTSIGVTPNKAKGTSVSSKQSKVP